MQNSQRMKKSNTELLLGILVFTLIISVMNMTMFNIALPDISKEFHLSLSQAGWIITGYMIVYAIGSVTYGKLSDSYSSKNLLTFGLWVFAIGSVVGFIANEYWILIVGRIIQAAGASVLPAFSMVVPVRYFPPEKRGHAMGIVAMGFTLGSALGPIVAGVVSSTWGWRILFVISLLSLLSLPMYRKYLDDEKQEKSKMDYIGGALLAGTVATLLFSLTSGNIWTVVALVIFFILFLVRIFSASAPFIDPDIFRNKQFSFSLAIAFVMIGVGFAIPFITPQLLSSINKLSSAYIGIVMSPAALTATILGRKGGKMADEKGNLLLVYISAALLVIGFVCLSSVAGMSPFLFAIFLIFAVVGQSLMLIAMTNTVSQTLSKEHTGVGMGLFTMVTFISAAVSTAITGKALDLGISAIHLNPINQNSATLKYSNIFLILAAVIVVTVIIYHVRFRRIKVEHKKI